MTAAVELPEGDADPLHPARVAARVAGWARGAPGGPLTLELYPTLSCNLDCAFCDTTDRHRPPVNELSRARLLALVDEAADLGVKRVFVLGGGEPLARKDAAPELLAAIKARGMEGVLTTNGTLLGPALAEQLVRTGWDEVHFSVDAPSAALHDHLRGRDGSFSRTVRNACRLSVLRRRLGRVSPRIALHFVLTRLNWRELPGMIRLAEALGAHRVDFDALIAYTPEQRALALLPDERAQVPAVAAEALALAEAAGIATTLGHFLQPERLDRGAAPPPAPAAASPGLGAAPCLRAWHYIVVQADGRVSPCCVLSGEGGSVADRPLAEVWAGDAYLEQVRAGMLRGQPQPRCRECSWNILGHEALIRSRLPADSLGLPPSAHPGHT